jgi:hypothetical protein
MGTYETLVGKCPNCGHEAEAQSKITTDTKELRSIAEGQQLKLRKDVPRTFTLECKNGCQCCGAKLIAIVEDSTFVGFKEGKPDLIESVFGLITEQNS